MELSFSIELGDTTYEIPRPTVKQARQWRARIEEPLDSLLALIGQTQAFQVDSVEDIIVGIKLIAKELIGAPDTIFELTMLFSPLLEANRAHIEETAYDEQVTTALVTFLKAVFPLEQLMNLFGRARSATSPSLPQPTVSRGRK